jgi:hypothetical protein
MVYLVTPKNTGDVLFSSLSKGRAFFRLLATAATVAAAIV